MDFKELEAMEEWTLKEACFVIGATLERAKRRQQKGFDANGTKMILASRSYDELTDRITAAFQMANSHLYADKDERILGLFSRALMWLEEVRSEPYDMEKARQYLLAGFTSTTKY